MDENKKSRKASGLGSKRKVVEEDKDETSGVSTEDLVIEVVENASDYDQTIALYREITAGRVFSSEDERLVLVRAVVHECDRLIRLYDHTPSFDLVDGAKDENASLIQKKSKIGHENTDKTFPEHASLLNLDETGVKDEIKSEEQRTGLEKAGEEKNIQKFINLIKIQAEALLILSETEGIQYIQEALDRFELATAEASNTEDDILKWSLEVSFLRAKLVFLYAKYNGESEELNSIGISGEKILESPEATVLKLKDLLFKFSKDPKFMNDVFVELIDSLLDVIQCENFNQIGDLLFEFVSLGHFEVYLNREQSFLFENVRLLTAIARVVQWKVHEEISCEEFESLSGSISKVWPLVKNLMRESWRQFDDLRVPGEQLRLSLGRCISEAFNLEACICEINGEKANYSDAVHVYRHLQERYGVEIPEELLALESDSFQV